MSELPNASHALLDNALEGTGDDWIEKGARPCSWMCCECDYDENYVHDREPCLGCSHYPCPGCTVLDLNARQLKTLAGQNLRPDRLEPGGWQCCDCRNVILRSLPWNDPDDTDVSVHIAGERYHLSFECHGPGCRHFICGDCTLLNPYGEELGLIGHDSFQLVPRGPLHEHKQWCENQQAQVYAAVDGYCGPIFQSNDFNAVCGAFMQLPSALEADEQVVEVGDLVDELDTWVDELKEAIDDALWNEDSSDEDGGDEDGGDEDDSDEDDSDEDDNAWYSGDSD